MSDIVLLSDSADRTHWFRGIGTYRIATELRKMGYSVRIIDFIGFYNFETWKQLMATALTPDTKFVGISATWMAKPYLLGGRFSNIVQGNGEEDFQSDDLYFQSFSYAFTFDLEEKFIDFIKDISPNVKIVMGGSGAVDFIHKKYVDHVFLGFSESQIIQFFDQSMKKRIFPRVINWDITGNSIWDFSTQGNTIYTEHDMIMPGETLPIEVGRGCIFHCKFCSFPLLGKKKGSYMKDPGVLYNELMDNYSKWGTTSYVISDETFNDDTDKLIELREIVRKLPFRPQFWAFCRLDLLEKFPEQAQILLDLGLKQAMVGFESFNDKTSKTIGKGLSAERKKEVTKFAKSVWGDQIRIKGNFIIGLPYETTDSVRETAEWILSKDCPIDYASFTAYILLRRDNLQHLRWNSAFDKEYEKWGYSFKENESPLYWYKTDDTDIDSYVSANKIANFWQNKFTERNIPTEMFYYANDRWHDLSLDKLFQLNSQEFYELKNSSNYNSHLFFDQVKKYYVDPLLKK